MNETSKNQRKKSLLGQLSDLAVGEELTVPVSSSSYLKSILCQFRPAMGQEVFNIY